MFSGRHLIRLLVGGHGGRQEPNLVQLALLATALGQNQVAVVDRIKSTAKYSQSNNPSTGKTPSPNSAGPKASIVDRQASSKSSLGFILADRHLPPHYGISNEQNGRWSCGSAYIFRCQRRNHLIPQSAHSTNCYGASSCQTLIFPVKMTLPTQDPSPADMESCPEPAADSLPVLPRGTNDRIPG